MENKLKHLNQERYGYIVEIAKHTIGMDYKKPFRKDGSQIYLPYRNYFNTYVGRDGFDELEKAGYASHREIHRDEDGRETTDYYLTPDGLKWLAQETRCNICLTY